MLSRGMVTVALGAFLCGCPDPNTYGTPRTLAPGDLQLQGSLGAWGGVANGSNGALPSLPSVGVRYGVADRLDVGARLVDFFGLGGDIKYNFVRGPVDLAIDPMLQAFYVPAIQLTPSSSYSNATGIAQVHLPLLIGINFDDATTLVLTPGIVGTLATGSASDNPYAGAQQIAFASTGLGARLGIGLNIRTSDTFSWQPEVTAWHEFNGVDSWVCVAGIGINIGAQPDYSDLAPR